MVMSLDNVLAIAAIAKDNTAMLILGLVISIPLIRGRRDRSRQA
jgi:predicted tellurium resistance membrane protein TerC